MSQQKLTNNQDVTPSVVMTVGGTTELKEKCRVVKGVYYLIDRDIFFLGSKWRRVETLYYDAETKQYMASSKGMVKGIVSLTSKGEYVMGTFTSNPYTNVKLIDNNKSVELAVQDGRIFEAFPGKYYRERGTDNWYVTGAQGYGSEAQHKAIHTSMNFTSKGYNIEDNAQEFVQKIKLLDEYPLTLSKDVRAYARFLGDLSFGVELEMAKGCLSETDQNKHGVVFCRDGSTSSSGEAVTVPYRGAKGLQTLSNLADVAVQDMAPDITCSYHIHIGGVKITRNLVVTMYRLGEKLQDELFGMFPYYKTNWKDIKKKNYCQKLAPKFPTYKGNLGNVVNYKEYVKQAYDCLFYFLSDEHQPCQAYNTKAAKHPVEAKWNRKNRYFWLNLLNTMFSDRRTIEFRLHQATLNPQKIINWLFMCAAMVHFAESKQNLIMSDRAITVEMVLNYYRDTFPKSRRATFLSEYLNAYFKDRKKDMELATKKKDFTGDIDLQGDADYTFTYKGVTRLF